MLRSPGSSRPARPFVPEEVDLKLRLLGAQLMWDPGSRSFAIATPGSSMIGVMVQVEAIEARGWDEILSDIADRLVKARVPAGHMSGLSRIAPVVVEAASVIDEEFK